MAVVYPCSADVEARRLAELHRADLIDTPSEAEFDAVVAIACRLFDCPIATVSLIDDHRQWFKARIGFDADVCSREGSPCATTLYEPDILVIEDMSRDPRFAAHPMVVGNPGVRFYAGVPLQPGDTTLPGIGTLCILDVKPRQLSEQDAARLRDLGTLLCAIIRARISATAAARLSVEVQNSADVIRGQNVQLAQAERMVGVGSWRFDPRDESLRWSDHVYTIYGIPPGSPISYEEGLGAYPPEPRARLAALIERAVTAGEPFDFESDFTPRDGVLRRVRVMAEPQMHGDTVSGIVGVFQDVTDRHRLEQSLQKTANTDVLTGLPNRREFEERLTLAFDHARADDAPLVLMLLDLDGFKAVNDVLGHEAGDEVLCTIAHRLREEALHCAFAARLGGDEFVLLFTRRRDCQDVIGLVRTVLAQGRATVKRDGIEKAVSVTVGAAMLGEDVATPQELLRRADIALYDSKRAQRGTGRLYGAAEAIRRDGGGAPALRSVA